MKENWKRNVIDDGSCRTARRAPSSDSFSFPSWRRKEAIVSIVRDEIKKRIDAGERSVRSVIKSSLSWAQHIKEKETYGPKETVDQDLSFPASFPSLVTFGLLFLFLLLMSPKVREGKRKRIMLDFLSSTSFSLFPMNERLYKEKKDKDLPLIQKERKKLTGNQGWPLVEMGFKSSLRAIDLWSQP